jgi:hypothetical protein
MSPQTTYAFRTELTAVHSVTGDAFWSAADRDHFLSQPECVPTDLAALLAQA